MMYREIPEIKIFILTCRSLIHKGSFLREGIVFSACVAEDFEEAINRFGVTNKSPNGIAICPMTGQWIKWVKMLKDPPSWFDGHTENWKNFLNERLLWEVVLVSDVIKDSVQLFHGSLWDIKKIKAI